MQCKSRYCPSLVSSRQAECDAECRQSPVICTCLKPGEAVCMPPRLRPGRVNSADRLAAYKKYAENPLVIRLRCETGMLASSLAGARNRSLQRHFIGFGFSKELPYFPPGTRLCFLDSEDGGGEVECIITGMCAAGCRRASEYALILSLDRPMHDDLIAYFLDSFVTTELDSNEQVCEQVATLIQTHAYVVGDIDPECVGTAKMQEAVWGKFGQELQRMDMAVSLVISRLSKHPCNSAAEFERQKGLIRSAYDEYRTLLRMQMRDQPIGTSQWMQMFENYMSFAACEKGLGWLDFVLR
jgi:hypothetical protein